VVAVFLVIGTGCGTVRAQRGANLLASYTNSVRAEAERVAAARDALAKARLANIQDLEQSLLETEFRNATEAFLLGLTTGAKQRLSLLEGIVAGTGRAQRHHEEMQTLRAAQEQALAATRSRMQVNSEKLGSTAKALGELAKRQSLLEGLEFYVAFFEEVAGAIEKDNEDARQATASGEEGAQAKGPVQ
jgi:hypothetical protein